MIEDLALLINTLLKNEALPTSKYLFKQRFNTNRSHMEPTIHLTCSNCSYYLGKKQAFEGLKNIRCVNCKRNTSVETKYRKNHFITLPVEPQIVSIVERSIKKNIFIREPSAAMDETITDVFDGTLYKTLKSEIGEKPFITLTVSTDGAVVYKSTKEKSFWPLHFFVNEIEIKHRFKRENMICVAFAFGKTPDMSSFLQFFINEINEINAKGGLTVRIGNDFDKFMVFPWALTTDSVAKSYVAKRKQFNSHEGCPYCYHTGTILAGSTQIRYCNRHNAGERTHAEAKSAMIEAALTGKTVRGYTGVSPMLALDSQFDIVWQIVIDKMHSIDLGVTKKIFNIILNSSNSRKE